MGTFQRKLVLGVLAVVERPKLTLAIAGVAMVACLALAYFRLDISTDQNKLFSDKAKFFADYLEFDRKFPENEAVYAVLERFDRTGMPKIDRWTAAADTIAERVRTLGSEHVRSVDARVPLDQLGDQGLLFEQPEAVEQRVAEVRRFIPLVKILGEKPNVLTQVLGPTLIDRFLSAQSAGPADASQAKFVAAVVRSWNETLKKPAESASPTVHLPDLASVGATSPRDLGYYWEPDATDASNPLLLVRIYPNVKFDSLDALLRPVIAIRAAVKEAAKEYPEFRIGLTGRPVLAADEMSTSDRDSHRAEAVALAVVFIGLVVSIRSVWLAVAAEISLIVAIGWTFGWAELAVGHLNLLSLVFLIALIGIGMDYLVQILVRYRHEMARHTRPRAVWARVFRHVGPPINTACLGAAGAFLVAIFTDFRGAAELGKIAGGGLLLCLLSGYTVLPALLTLFPARTKKQSDAASPAGSTASAVGPAPGGGWRLLFPAIWATALVVGIALFAGRTGFNPNLLDLQAQKLESVQLVRKLQTFSAVVLSKDLDLLRRVRAAVDHLPSVASTDSLLKAQDNATWLKANAQLPEIQWVEPMPVKSNDLHWLRGKAQNLSKKFMEAAAKPDVEDRRALQDASGALAWFSAGIEKSHADQLTLWQPAFITQMKTMLQQFNPGQPRVDALPKELRGHYVADDGTVALYIYPKQDLWDRDNLARFMIEIEPAVRAVPGAPDVTGIASDLFHTTHSIEQSFYKSAAYALALIFLLVLIDLRNLPQTFIAISVLALGLPMLVSIMGLIGADWNFANFFGLPILIGAGHEYGVFMVHRYREARNDPRRYWRRWDASDKALLLCAFVTCSSFGFFWLLANHQGLKSLGLVMTLGTACIYLATLLVVRPLLLWNLNRKRAIKTSHAE